MRHIVLILAIFLAAATAGAQTQRIRIMAANTTSGNNQSYLDPGDRIFQGLDPDIALIQEFTIGSGSSQDATTTTNWVAANFGPGFHWYREPGNEQIPNGIVSRWPIVASGQIDDDNVSNRDHAWARIDIPGDKDLWVASVHLLTSSSGNRNSQAQVLVNGFNALNIPAGDYVVIGGDFNTDSRSESAVGTFRSYLGVSSGQEFIPRDGGGDDDTNANRNKPYDWVLVDSDLNAFHDSVRIGANTFPGGLVFDSRVYSPLSDVAPVQSGDSGATNMQHMAVIKDYVVPTGQSDYTVATQTVNFGTVNFDNAPFEDNSIGLTSQIGDIEISGFQFTGPFAGEFSLGSPAIPVTTAATQNFTIFWSPDGSSGVQRNVTATVTTDATPATFNVTITGTPVTGGMGGGGEPIDVGGWKVIDATNAARVGTIPNGTMIPPNGFLVIGRLFSKGEFETAHGVTLGPDVVYLGGPQVSGDANGFPIINGGQSYRLEDAFGVQKDPPLGSVPSGGVTTTRTYRRQRSNSTVFVDESMSLSDPGTWGGIRDETGKVIITEVSDASPFESEFVELYFDAIPVTEPEGSYWSVP